MATSQGLVRSVGYVDSDGERIYFEMTGRGAPVVLCHGLGGNHAIWWRQIEAFAAQRLVITWDQRGFGNSTLITGDVSPAAAQRDLGALLDHLGLDSVDLVGQSMGGWTVLGYALEHPDRVRSMVLSTTLAGADKKYVDALVNAEADQDRFNRREHPVLSRQFCRQHPDLGVLYNQISSFGAKPSPVGVLQAMANHRFDESAVRALPVPTFVVAASEDELCPPHAMEAMVEGMADAGLAVVPGGHSVYYEDPETWNSAVLGFLHQQDLRPARLRQQD
jgi:pimeloyl-ACP methyl ester carboxylesterase